MSELALTRNEWPCASTGFSTAGIDWTSTRPFQSCSPLRPSRMYISSPRRPGRAGTRPASAYPQLPRESA
eukprot:scaffold7328_cov314-Pinguiococcus_pyrenoidosus.AAC.57